MESQRQIEQFRAVNDIGQTALKSGLVINGGGAIALLALISNLIPDHTDIAIKFSSCILIFGLGALSSALSPAVAYLAAYGEDFESGEFSVLGIVLGIFSVVLLTCSPLAFLFGLYELSKVLLSI